jgi:hypothetical protein
MIGSFRVVDVLFPEMEPSLRNGGVKLYSFDMDLSLKPRHVRVAFQSEQVAISLPNRSILSIEIVYPTLVRTTPLIDGRPLK